MNQTQLFCYCIVIYIHNVGWVEFEEYKKIFLNFITCLAYVSHMFSFSLKWAIQCSLRNSGGGCVAVLSKLNNYQNICKCD